jgi:hypothetical protein
MKSSKMKVVVSGMEFNISSDSLRSKDYWGKPLDKPYIYGGPKVGGEFVKQFVKKKFPNVECSVKSDHFANGNSLHINLWYMDGTPVEESIVREVNSFAHLFEYGRYDGMHDIYESYETSGLSSDDGLKIDAGVKYVSVENRPNHNSITHHILMLKGMVKGEYNFGPVSIDEAVMRAKKWGYKGPNFEKAILMVA